jgi:hypothetical protein
MAPLLLPNRLFLFSWLWMCWRLDYLKIKLSQPAWDFAVHGDKTINIIYAAKPFSRVK